MSSILEMCKKNYESDSNYHLGRMFLDCMARRDPEGICTIDGATGKQETNASVLTRSIALARSFRRFGLKPGDVLALGGPLHLDIHIPYYAALLEGLPIVGVDPLFKYDEIKALFKTTEPKIAFCQHKSLEAYSRAAKDLGLDVKIVTFDNGECTLSKFMDIYRDNESEEKFQPAHFDTDKVYAWLVPTSGTTGLPKFAAFKHHVLIKKFIKFFEMFPASEKTKIVGNFSPVQWISSYFNAIYYPLVNQTKLQSSKIEDIDHLVDVINEYKPISMLTSPATMSSILRSEKQCDLSCFDVVIITGAKFSEELMTDLRSRMNPRASAMEGYGQTEMGGPVFLPNPRGPLGSCGIPLPTMPVQLVDKTGAVITEPKEIGELWVKGTGFTEYYKDPTTTAQAFSEDGWYKTGDLLHRDENNNYFFFDRIKLLIKYKGTHIAPKEIENVILTLKGVKEVCVTSIPHIEDGQLPVACVVRRAGGDVTAHEIKRLVAETLSVHKQLRGGVVFLDHLPLTSTGKVARPALQKLVLEAKRE